MAGSRKAPENADEMSQSQRDAMTADVFDPVGIYFGTRSGDLYGSADEGKAWTKIVDGLPPIACVKSGTVGDPAAVRKAPLPRPKARRKAKR